MENTWENLSTDEQMALLEESNPEAHRILASIVKARGEKEEGLPVAFSYVRALQEYDKERGLSREKGQNLHVMKQYDHITGKNKNSK